MRIETDIVIVGTGVAGLFCALNLPQNKRILIITKSKLEESDSYLAQGGICVLKNEEDYNSFFRDTINAGHNENDTDSVRQMILRSQEIIRDLVSYGVEFEQENGSFKYTKEGAHSTARILYHKDVTGKEITSRLIAQVKERRNITIAEDTEMLDLISSNNICTGIIVCDKNRVITRVDADYIVFATGGIGGLYESSTNYSHLTGDALALAILHKIELKNTNYIQIHPTTLYSKKKGRRFLISESVRGEGALLYNSKLERFVDELLPRDLLTKEIYHQMKQDGRDYVWLSVKHLGSRSIKKRFPNIYEHCLREGIDITKEYIPVTPAQHYYMGGIKVDLNSRTSMEHLYAVGETSCNGVHGANRLASNSLLESLVFAKMGAAHIADTYEIKPCVKPLISLNSYQATEQLRAEHMELVRREIERSSKNEQSYNTKIKCG